jgi:hypothetical protein
MKTAAIALASALAALGCSARHTILTVPAVSMTNPSFDPGHTATAGEHVEAQYCRGDAPLASHDNNIGLIDEAVMKAQKQSGAQYLSDVTISRDGSCVVVEATAMK